MAFFVRLRSHFFEVKKQTTMGIYFVKEKEAMVVERMGCYHKTLNTGLCLTAWPLDKTRQVFWHWDDVRPANKAVLTDHIPYNQTNMYDPPEIKAVTKDSVTIRIDTVVHFQILDVKKAVYETADLFASLQETLKTSLVRSVGSMNFEEIIRDRSDLQGQILSDVSERLDSWGAKIVAVEIQNIESPKDLMKSTENIVKSRQQAELGLLNEKIISEENILKANSKKKLKEIQVEMEMMEHKFRLEARGKEMEQNQFWRIKRYKAFFESGLDHTCYIAELMADGMESRSTRSRETGGDGDTNVDRHVNYHVLADYQDMMPFTSLIKKQRKE